MGCRIACCSLLLLLLMAMVAEAKRTTIREKQEEFSAENGVIKMVGDGERKEMVHDSHKNSMDNQNEEMHMHLHLDPSSTIFFTIEDLKLGKKLPIYFPKRDPSSYPPLLPKETADKIPFSLKQLPEILNFFSFSPESPQAKAVESTLQLCDMKHFKGETKLCATSSESMESFVRAAFGGDSGFKRLSTAHIKNSGVQFQKYTFTRSPIQIEAPKLVSCHTLPYPYGVNYCHYLEGDNKVMKIAMEGENGDLVVAIAVCHMDSSGWHPSLKLLTKDGSAPICHFFPSDDSVWIPEA